MGFQFFMLPLSILQVLGFTLQAVVLFTLSKQMLGFKILESLWDFDFCMPPFSTQVLAYTLQAVVWFILSNYNCISLSGLMFYSID